MIVILGGTGYVGQAFVRLLKERKIEHANFSRAEIDYSQPLELSSALRELRPDFLINCAGYTGKPNVDACEDDKFNCLDGNAVLPGKINAVCAELGIKWGHVSSGCVFSGRRADGGGFVETDPPNFCFRGNHCSFYSGTKALGEEILGYASTDSGGGQGWFHHDQPDAYIWRLRIPFDHRANPRNYLTKIMTYRRLLQAENSISHLDEFAGAAWACFEKALPLGIYNVTNPGAITTKRVAELMAERSQTLESAGKTSPFPTDFAFFNDEKEFMHHAARAPRSNCVLDSGKLAQHGITLRPVEQAVRESLEQWHDV